MNEWACFLSCVSCGGVSVFSLLKKVLTGIKQILHLYLVVGHMGFTCNFNFPGGVWQGREKLLLRSFFTEMLYPHWLLLPIGIFDYHIFRDAFNTL